MGNYLLVIIDFLYWALFILILARIILSWVRTGAYELRAIVFRITDPILEPIRRLMPPMGGLDFSPFIVMILAYVIRELLQSLVVSL